MVGVADVVLVSAIVWTTGGVGSEYCPLYFLPIVVAAVRLDMYAGIAVSGTAACLYEVVALTASQQPSVLSYEAASTLRIFVGFSTIGLLFLLLGRESKLSNDLRDTLHHSLRRVAAVYEVAHAANTGANLTGVLTIILDHAARATNAANGSVFLLTKEKELRPVASLYTPSGGAEPLAQPPMEPAMEAVRRAEPMTISMTLADGSPPVSVVYIPLHMATHHAAMAVDSTDSVTPAGALGVLVLVSAQGKQFASRHLEFLSPLCSEAALAIENARLRSELHRLAVTDPLTGMLNRREVERELGRELERAYRYNRPLSVVLLDVDHLKKVNDGFGHAAGDEILIALARMLQRITRSTEIAGRIGGDEFMVVLPETEARDAAALADRIVEGLPEALRAWPNLAEADRIAPLVGLSAGIADTGDGVNSPERLTARADAALYEAKRSGRNRVCTTMQQSAVW